MAIVSAVSAPALGQVRFHSEADGATVKVMSWRDIPFRTIVRQQYDYSCGSAALATLLTHHYGRPTSESEAFRAMYAAGDQARIQQVGFSMLDMKVYLESLGLGSDGYRLSIDELARSRTPAIALIQVGSYKHFVVVKGVSGDRVLVGDPALGLKTYSRAEFLKMWNGIAFALHEDSPLGRPVFNAVHEWTPWSVAPVGATQTSDVISHVTNDQMPLYQVKLPPFDLNSVIPGFPY